jgi:hypothetical protein
MSAQVLIRLAQEAGVALRLLDGKVKARGPREAIDRLLEPLREHREALVDALRAEQLECLPESQADIVTHSGDWNVMSRAYLVHHFNCQKCIAAGRGSRYGLRCSVGVLLWRVYRECLEPDIESQY